MLDDGVDGRAGRVLHKACSKSMATTRLSILKFGPTDHTTTPANPVTDVGAEHSVKAGNVVSYICKATEDVLEKSACNDAVIGSVVER